MSRYKVRDDLKVDYYYGKYFTNIMEKYKGKIITISKCYSDCYCSKEEEYMHCTWTDAMIERKVNDDMTKSDLRSGMIIETRDRERYITIIKEDSSIHFMNLDGKVYLDDYELLDDMTDKRNPDYDIIKIYNMSDTLNDCKTTKDLIWER